MEKAKVFIASSGRTLTLAEKLRDELQTEFCEGVLWAEESKHQPGATIIEMLENAGEKYDFAVIILARDDVIVRGKDDTLKARDNCVFEAGMFVAYLKRERCFLVNSVEQRDLPSDLGGVISLPFAEPDNLSDRQACAEALRNVSATIKDSIQRLGRVVIHTRVSLLSVDEVFQRERLNTDGGDLHEGQIVVICDLQPLGGPELAAQVSRNLDGGISYLYFLSFSDDTIEKICQALQIILLEGVDGTGQVANFGARSQIVKTQQDRIKDYLKRICSDHLLRIALLPTPPQFCFRVHNATDQNLARLYMRYRASGFILWSEGESALSLMRDLRDYIPVEERERIFFPLKQFPFSYENKRRFENALDRGLAKYFPGIQDEVKRICLGR
jgi:hypothetical protein